MPLGEFDCPMSEPDKLFTDGEAYERLMGRWSRVVAQEFLDWLNVPKNLRWLDIGLWKRRVHRGTERPLCARSRDGNRSVR